MTEEISLEVSPAKNGVLDHVSEEDLKLEEIITKPTNAQERDDTYSVRASKSKGILKIARQSLFTSFPKD